MPKKAVEAPVIKVNDRFSITSDPYNWVLREYRKTKSRKNPGKTVTAVRETFHGTLSQVLNTIMQRGLKDAKTLAQFNKCLANMEKLQKQINKEIETAYVSTRS